jgi:hypothetical protein
LIIQHIFQGVDFCGLPERATIAHRVNAILRPAFTIGIHGQGLASRMKAKITKRLVDETLPAEKPVFIFDTELAGFVLKITSAGRKTYQFRYRMGGRNTPLRTYTVGKHGSLTPDQARRMAQTLLGDVRRGIDPAAEKAKKESEDRGALTVEMLSAEFLEIYGQTKLKPRSLEEYDRAFRSHINPRIGQLKVRDVSHGDVERLHHAMRATPATANRTVAALSKFFSWAMRGGYRPDRHNPCSGLEKYKEQPRERYLSPSEIAVLGDAIRKCETDGELTPWQAALFRALLLTDDLRHTAASIGVASGASLALIGGVLGHKSQQTTQRYAHLSDDPVRAVSDDIANRIDRTMEGKGAEIIKLKPAGKS